MRSRSFFIGKNEKRDNPVFQCFWETENGTIPGKTGQLASMQMDMAVTYQSHYPPLIKTTDRSPTPFWTVHAFTGISRFLFHAFVCGWMGEKDQYY